MKKLTSFVLLLSFILFSIPLSAQTKVIYTAYQSETLTIDATAGGIFFTVAKVQSPTDVTINAEVAQFTVNCASGTSCVLRFTIDGSTVTTSHGFRALYGDNVTITGHANIMAFRGLRETGTSCVIDATYSRPQ